jgi:hypothetical protein
MSASTWTGSLPSCAGMACCIGMQPSEINTEAHKNLWSDGTKLLRFPLSAPALPLSASETHGGSAAPARFTVLLCFIAYLDVVRLHPDALCSPRYLFPALGQSAFEPATGSRRSNPQSVNVRSELFCDRESLVISLGKYCKGCRYKLMCNVLRMPGRSCARKYATRLVWSCGKLHPAGYCLLCRHQARKAAARELGACFVVLQCCSVCRLLS